MKLMRVLGGGVFAFLFGYAIFGSVEVARAQSACGCPVGSFVTEGGLCVVISRSEQEIIFNPTCKTPQIGQIAASQQQLSFSPVAGVLRTRRDQLQGPLGSQSNPTSPLAYSTFNLDESYHLLGYAPGEKKPLRKA